MAAFRPVYLAAGLRTPFTNIDAGLAKRNAISLGVPVVQAMAAQVARPPADGRPAIDFGIWGSVIPNLGFSNLAREIWLDAKLDPSVPTFTTIMACSTSMVAAFEAAGFISRGNGDLALVGGSESMTHIQIGLTAPFSDWMRRLTGARTWKRRAEIASDLHFHDVRLHIPKIQNRTTHKSMGEHTEEMAKTWAIGRQEQDEWALRSHQHAVTGQKGGFYTDLLVPVDGVEKDTFPRANTSLEQLGHLKPAFDRTSGEGTLTAGNSTPLTDGAAGLWVASEAGLERLPARVPRAKLLDFETAAVDILNEGLLMAPAYAIPRLLARNRLTYADIGLYEIHEAFAAQVLCHLKALESAEFLRDKARVTASLGTVPRDRINPFGGSVALGHPFGATGARILSQAVKELSAMPRGTRAIVSICADGGVGTVALLEN